MNRDIPYPKASPAINAFTALILACASVIFLALSGNVSRVWTAAFSAVLFSAVAVVYVSPLFTAHAVSGGRFRIRYGLIFRADVPLEAIDEVRALEPGEKARGALDLTTERSRRVLLVLNERRRFAHALGMSYGKITFSAEDVPGAIAALEPGRSGGA